MDNIVMLFACLAPGIALRRSKQVPDNANTSINAFIIHVSLPALTLLQVRAVRLDPTLLHPVFMPWPLFRVSAALVRMVGSAFRLPRTTTRALAIVGGTFIAHQAKRQV
jgi:predicted permease